MGVKVKDVLMLLLLVVSVVGLKNAEDLLLEVLAVQFRLQR